LNHYGLVFYFVIFLLFSPQEQRLLSLPLVPHLWIRGQEGAAGPREAEARREGSQRWKAHDRPGKKRLGQNRRPAEERKSSSSSLNCVLLFLVNKLLDRNFSFDIERVKNVFITVTEKNVHV